MSQDWRNDNLQRIRMCEDATPEQPQTKQAPEGVRWRRSDVIFVGTLLSAMIGIICYMCGEWQGSAKVAATAQPITLEELCLKYGDQEWARRSDDERVIGVWDTSRKIMTYLHLTDADYAALCDEHGNWKRGDGIRMPASTALRKRAPHPTTISNPQQK